MAEEWMLELFARLFVLGVVADLMIARDSDDMGWAYQIVHSVKRNE
jgi:hypothetical protein